MDKKKTTIWYNHGSIWKMDEPSDSYSELPLGVYTLHMSMKGPYLSKMCDEFVFDYKLYNVCNDDFVNRVVKTYEGTTDNLGVLLNGMKGTGKSVTAKQLCNKLKLPVIVVTDDLDGAVPMFINDVEQDIVVFIDEYEKIFKKEDGDILVVMDGVLESTYRRVFLLTTNTLYINDNLLERPGRIRYLVEYRDLGLEGITEIVDDLLIHKDWRTQTIKFLSGLQKITIDIVKSVVEEINIHNEDPENFKDVFNVREGTEVYNVYSCPKITDPLVLTIQGVKVNIIRFTSRHKGQSFYIDDEYVGTIKSIISENTAIVVDYDDRDKKTEKVYKIENVKHVHNSFQNYTF